MPNINEFLKKSGKEHSKKSDWDLSSSVIQTNTPTRPQRRPGRGEDAPNLAPLNNQPFDSKMITQEKQTGNKSDNKPTTNWQQTDNKVGTQPTTNWQQTDNKTGNKTGNKKGNWQQSGNKVGTQPTTLSATNWQQTGNKLATKTFFSSLVGLQRAAMTFLYEECKKSRCRSTDALTLEHISYCLKTPSGSLKTTLQRLESKGCISRVGFKNGRGGWSKYELPEPIFREMLQLETENKVATNRQQTGNKVGTQPATQPTTSSSSSSSILSSYESLNTTTTEHNLNAQELPSDWKEIDCTPLQELGIKFGESQLQTIHERGILKPSEVQDSIEAFAFDLKENNKANECKKEPLRFFMGILRKGPYIPPSNFESQSDRQRRLYLESKRRQAERRRAIEAEILELEFDEWKSKLTFAQRQVIAPLAKGDGGPMQNALLKRHFVENIRGQDPVLEAEGELSAEQVRAICDQELGPINN